MRSSMVTSSGGGSRRAFLQGAGAMLALPLLGSGSFKNTISLDQFAAEQAGPQTRFPSFVLGIRPDGPQGHSFSRSGVRIPTENSPAALFRQMFVLGKSEDVEARIKI